MTTSDRSRPGAPTVPPPPAEIPLGAQGGFPPPPPLADEPAGEPATEPAAAAGTSTMAVLGLVFAFLVPVLGIVFSAVGLAQTRRGQGGRRLAVAGLVVSLVLTAVVVVLLVTVGTPARRTVDRAAAPPASSAGPSAPVPAGNPAHEAVVAACAQVMPAMTRLERDLGSATTVDDVATRVTALQRQITAAAAASGDPAFAGQARALAADFGRLVEAARNGGDPATVVGSIEQDGVALGQSCGAAGWLP